MAHLDALNASASPKYDNSNHTAAPMRLQWLNRHGDPTVPRWVFLRCCGQIGTKGADDIIRSRLPCDTAVPVDARGHGGKLLLHMRNGSRKQARLHGGDLAHWSCCGASALAAWEAAWDGVGRISLRRLAANGCAAGVDAPQPGPVDDSVVAEDDDFFAFLETMPIDGASASAIGSRVNATTIARSDDASASLALVATPLHPVPIPPRPIPRPIPALSWREILHAHLRPSLAPTGAAALADAAPPPIPSAFRTVAPPTPSRAVEGILLDTFNLSLLEAASAVWPRGAGGDGCCELLAARGDRLLEWIVVQQLPQTLRAECDVATHTIKYTCNASLAAAARVLTLNGELRIRMGGREPSEHELGTVVEALLMAAHTAKGMDVSSRAVCKLMAIIDALPPLPSRASAGAGSPSSIVSQAGSAIELLMHHVIQLRLSLPLFEVEANRDGDGHANYRVRIIVVERPAEGDEQDVVLATGPWKSSRGAAREYAAAAMLQS